MLQVKLPQGSLNTLGGGSYDLSWQKEVGKLLNSVEDYYPTWLELKSVQTDLHWCGDRFKVAHYGVNPKLFLDADPEPFRIHRYSGAIRTASRKSGSRKKPSNALLGTTQNKPANRFNRWHFSLAWICSTLQGNKWRQADIN